MAVNIKDEWSSGELRIENDTVFVTATLTALRGFASSGKRRRAEGNTVKLVKLREDGSFGSAIRDGNISSYSYNKDNNTMRFRFSTQVLRELSGTYSSVAITLDNVNWRAISVRGDNLSFKTNTFVLAVDDWRFVQYTHEWVRQFVKRIPAHVSKRNVFDKWFGGVDIHTGYMSNWTIGWNNRVNVIEHRYIGTDPHNWRWWWYFKTDMPNTLLNVGGVIRLTDDNGVCFSVIYVSVGGWNTFIPWVQRIGDDGSRFTPPWRGKVHKNSSPNWPSMNLQHPKEWYLRKYDERGNYLVGQDA